MWRKYIFLIVLSIGFCEFCADYIKIWSCQWPRLQSENMEEWDLNTNILRVMILADTHLLGPIRGHWLDKLYREWHMRRAFQTTLFLHKPDAVFVLGDLFDEGDMVGHKEFKEYTRRFLNLFRTPPSIPIISAVGNHDVGFHYKMHPYFVDRFENYFNNTGVQLYTIRGSHFVLINSMAMENDGCDLCTKAINELQQITENLNCLKAPKICKNKKILEHNKVYSRPIVLQHFPTYRISDKSCREHDAPDIEKYREKWEVLSKNSTDWLGKLLNPRLSFAGHTHHYCYSINRWGIEEYTVASFSWRNKINPSFLMVSLTPTLHQVFKCDMLHQQLVYNTYKASLIVLLFLFIWDIMRNMLSLTSKLKVTNKIN